MKPVGLRRVLGANLIAFAILIGSCAAQAQEKSKSSVGAGWTFNVAPYLWLAGVEGRSATLPPLPAAGQHPFRTGLLTVGLPGSPRGLHPKDPTIAELLKKHGYMTGQFA